MAYTPSQSFIKRVAMLESGNNPLAKNPKTSAKGLFQFINSTAEKYGLDDPFDAEKATEAFKSLTADNYEALKDELGREPTEAELYLAHQQGARGALKLLSNPDSSAVDVVGKNEVLRNGGTAEMTAADFANLWAGKYEQENDPLAMVEMADSGQIKNDAPSGMLDFSGQGESIDLPDFSEQGESVEAPQEPIKGMNQNTGKFRTAIDQFNQGTLAGWGDEVTDPLGALIASAGGAGDFGDLYKEARATTKENLPAQRVAHPVLSTAANIGGGVTGAIGAGKFIPKGVSDPLAKFARANPNIAAGLVGGGGAGVYSAGASEKDGLERLSNVPLDAALGVAGGVAGAQALRQGSRLVNNLAARIPPEIKTKIAQALASGASMDDAMRFAQGANPQTMGVGGILDDASVMASQAAAGSQSVDLSPTKLIGMLDEDDAAKLAQGRVLPLTRGERGQNVKIQRAEEIARKAGSVPFQKAAAEQQAAGYKPFLGMLGDDQLLDAPALAGRQQDEILGAAQIVRDQYDDLGRRVSTAYKMARETGEGVGIKAQNIQEVFLGGVDDFLTMENVRAGDIPKLDKELDGLREILAPLHGEERVAFNVNHMNLNALEAWKKRLNRAIGNTMEPADKRILEQVGRQYDDFLSNLADDAIVNGDDTAINAFSKMQPRKISSDLYFDPNKSLRQNLQDIPEDSFNDDISTEMYDTAKTYVSDIEEEVGNILKKNGFEISTSEESRQSLSTYWNIRKVASDIMDDDAAKVRFSDHGERSGSGSDVYSFWGESPEKIAKEILEKVGVKSPKLSSGNKEAINAFKEARSLAKQKFKFYESDKAIAKILDNRDLSGTELVNTIMGATKLSGKGEDGRIAETMLRLAGDKAPVMQENLKRGIMAKVLKDSLSGVKNPEDLSRDMLSFAKMKTSLGGLMNQREMFGTIFDDTEQQYFKQLYKDLELIASKQSGAVNNSSTGAYMADFIDGMGKVINNPVFKRIPAFGAGTTFLQGHLEKQAASIVTGKAEAGLSEFMTQAINEIDAPKLFYGAYGGQFMNDPISNDETEKNEIRRK